MRYSQPQYGALKLSNNPLANCIKHFTVGKIAEGFTVNGGATIVTDTIGLGFNFVSASSQRLSNTAPKITTYPFTVCALVKRTSVTGYNAVGGLRLDVTNEFEFYFDTGSHLGLYVNAPNGAEALVTTVTYTDLTRYYFVSFVVESATSRKIYMDGVLVKSSTVSFAPNPANTLYVGWGGGDYTNLVVPLFLMMDRALSADEIFSLANNPWQVFAPLPAISFTPAAGGAVANWLKQGYWWNQSYGTMPR